MRVLENLETSRFATYILLGWLSLFFLTGSAFSKGLGKPAVLDVNSVAPDPSAFTGTIKIRGVVSKVYPSDSAFVLIDRREYKACKVVTCADQFVIVRYRGDLPEAEQELVVTGEMVAFDNKFIFEGKEIEYKGK